MFMQNRKHGVQARANLSWACLLLFVFCLLVCRLHAADKIHLIWYGIDPRSSGIWEGDWIHEVLSDVKDPIEEIIDLEGKVFVDRSIVVYSSNSPREATLCYLKEWNRRGLKYGVIQLSDDLYDCPTEQLYPSFPFVIRNLWHKRFLQYPHVLCIPLGYKKGFWDHFQGGIKQSSLRRYNWSFAGQYRKSSRMNMIVSMVHIPQFHIHEIAWFGAPNSLSPPDYRDLLLESKFVPCPRGFWNLDNFRLSESLEAGCIPIVEKTPFDYFAKFYGDYPFLSVENWDEAPQLIEALLADPIALNQLQWRCFEWWHTYKLKVRREVAALIESKLMQE